MRLSAHGIDARLPDGWEGRIDASGRIPTPPDGAIAPYGLTRRHALPVAHLATFALPGERGDFGSGAVELMSRRDVFVALLEYGPASVGTPLFAGRGLPRSLRPDAFSPRALQRTLPGQAGVQVFVTEAGRAFCLYVVLGDSRERHRLVAETNHVLAAVEIAPAP